jgi:hypothetical protein
VTNECWTVLQLTVVLGTGCCVRHISLSPLSPGCTDTGGHRRSAPFRTSRLVVCVNACPSPLCARLVLSSARVPRWGWHALVWWLQLCACTHQGAACAFLTAHLCLNARQPNNFAGGETQFHACRGLILAHGTASVRPLVCSSLGAVLVRTHAGQHGAGVAGCKDWQCHSSCCL